MDDPGFLGVRLWTLSLRLAPHALARAQSLLAPDEAERAARFTFEDGRHRAIAGRGQLRAILGRSLGADPAALEFAYGPRGKPALAGPWAGAGWHFNLAHSGDLALLALTRAGPVGVDLERIRPVTDSTRLVSRFFSPREDAAFRALPEEQKPAAFLRLWTRKEAWLKATGEGITQSLGQVEVSFLPGEPPRLLSLPGGPEALSGWRLHDVDAGPACVAALATVAEAGPILLEPATN
jgi:4'-phosphopantetheinyl transferase